MKKEAIPLIAVIAIAAVVLTSLALLSEEQSEVDQEIADRFTWQCSGGDDVSMICIRPSEVKLGENLYITANNIPEDLTLRLAISNESGKVWDYIWADGGEKANWSLYIKPDYSVVNGFCTVDDLVGLWTIELQGTMDPPLRFQHGPAILEGAEIHYAKEKNVCP